MELNRDVNIYVTGPALLSVYCLINFGLSIPLLNSPNFQVHVDTDYDLLESSQEDFPVTVAAFCRILRNHKISWNEIKTAPTETSILFKLDEDSKTVFTLQFCRVQKPKTAKVLADALTGNMRNCLSLGNKPSAYHHPVIAFTHTDFLHATPTTNFHISLSTDDYIRKAWEMLSHNPTLFCLIIPYLIEMTVPPLINELNVKHHNRTLVVQST